MAEATISKVKINDYDLEIHTNQIMGPHHKKTVLKSADQMSNDFYRALKALVDSSIIDLDLPESWAPGYEELDAGENPRPLTQDIGPIINAYFHSVTIKDETDGRIGGTITMKIYNSNFAAPLIINTPYATENCLGDDANEKRMSSETSKNLWEVIDQAKAFIGGVRAQGDMFNNTEPEETTHAIESKSPAALITDQRPTTH